MYHPARCSITGNPGSGHCSMTLATAIKHAGAMHVPIAASGPGKLGYLLEKLGDDRVGETAVVLDHDHESTGAANHTVAVIGVQIAALVTVLVPWKQSFGQDGQAVDGNTGLDGLVTGQRHCAADIVFAIAGNVDHVPCGFEPVIGKQGDAMID